MSITTPRNARLSAAALAGAVLVTSLSGITAASASTVVAPASLVVVSQEVGPVDYDPITDPYTGHLADRVLGSDLVGPEPSGVDRTNERLLELERALKNGTVGYGGTYSLNGGTVKWSKLSGTTKLIVLRNTSSAWQSVIVPTTGALVKLAPHSGDIVSGVAAALNPYIPVQGAIAQAYLDGGGADVYGIPTTAEVAVTGGVKQTFTKSVWYWSSATGADPVKGAIGSKYGPNGHVTLGLPTTAEQKLASGGSWQPFQKGRIYWKSTTGAHIVDNGDIGKKYVLMGGSKSALGYPKSSKIKLSNSEYIQYFENGLIAWKNGYITVSTATPIATR